MSDRDCLQRFAFESFPVRGQIVHLNTTWQTILDRHDYPPSLRPVLGQALAATVLLASTLKFDGRMTLQVQGDGPLNFLVAQCTHDLQVRGLARWQSAVAGEPFNVQVGHGTLTITVQTSARPQPYQGIVPLTGGTLNECLGNYFDTSEQLSTRMWLAANNDSVAGLLLQRLPDAQQAADDDWGRIRLLAETARDSELLGLTNEQLLARLFQQDDLRVFDKRDVSFNCSCSAGRIEEMLRTLGEAELRSILAEQGHIAVCCEFCNMKHRFDPVDVTRIIAGAVDLPGPDSLH